MKQPIDRFSSKYEVDLNTGCWLWTAATKENGYGVFGRGPAGAGSAYAHRWSYEHFVGPIPEGMMVCHKCDVRNCVNPDHLFLGTAKDNQADMAAKGRSLRGERHNLAKLTEADVLEIRRLWATGQFTQREIAAKFGNNKQNVSVIVRGDKWKHLLPAGWTPPPKNRWSR